MVAYKTQIPKQPTLKLWPDSIYVVVIIEKSGFTKCLADYFHCRKKARLEAAFWRGNGTKTYVRRVAGVVLQK